MSVNAYINFNGNCREAVNFYETVFGTNAPEIRTFGEMPPDPNYPLPEEAKNLVMHTQLTIDGSAIMFSDIFPGMPFIEGNNFSLSYLSDDVEKIQLIFQKLSEGGKVEMELQETPWSKCYGQVVDRFGIFWQLNHDQT